MFIDKSGWATDRALWARLLRQVASLSGRYHDAGDYLNDAYIKLMEHDGPPIRNVEAFMVRIAVNLAHDEHRRLRRREFCTDDNLETVADAAPLQEEILDAHQRLKAVEAVLDRLSLRTREVLLMHRVDGLRYREIAERLGLSESAVEKHVAKAALRLLRASRAR